MVQAAGEPATVESVPDFRGLFEDVHDTLEKLAGLEQVLVPGARNPLHEVSISIESCFGTRSSRVAVYSGSLSRKVLFVRLIYLAR